MQARAYQVQALDTIYDKWERFQRIIVVMATGLGKTVVFAKIAAHESRCGNRILILCQREELIAQSLRTIDATSGIPCSIEKAQDRAADTSIVVASVQSMSNHERLARFKRDAFNVIICDEAHHIVSPTHKRIVEYFNDARLIGFTATGFRADKKALSEVFEIVAYEYGLKAAIKDKWLVPIVARTIPVQIDISKVKLSHGDFKPGELHDALTPYLSACADELKAINRKTLVFLPLVKTSKKFASLLQERGIKACHVSGESRDRTEIVRRFRDNEIDILCNAMLLTEGFDCPDISCIVVLRPTKSTPLYCQMVGRGTRPVKGKDNLLLPDFLWNVERHDLCRPADLYAPTPEIRASMVKQITSSQDEFPLDIAEENALQQVRHDREKTLARYIAANKNRKAKTLDPVWWELLACDQSSTYEPSFLWEREPATHAQKEFIDRSGFDPTSFTRGYAAYIIDSLMERRRDGLATPKQCKLLQRFGYKKVETMDYDKAMRIIDRIRKKGWKR